MADEDERDDASSQPDSSGAESVESEKIELLVTGRERRKTAGNRYDRDMVLEEGDNEEDPDEVALLFAAEDNEEDEEFRSDASDEDEMSSSDDDDQGPNAGAEDLEGEQELQKQAKDERAKKRKAELALTSTAGLRKKPKIDPTQQKIVPKPSKKKERLTWLPDVDNSAARSSSRKQTIAHREETLARLKESEAQSKKLRALKEKRDREKARDAPKAMTQADRLAEAERVERRNAKSLNRWEATEKKRTEEQAAKLAALKNRKIEGAVITLWSGKAHYRGPRPSQVWKEPDDNPAEPKKRGRKPKGYHEQIAAMRAAADSVPVSGQQTPASKNQTPTQPHITQPTPSQPPTPLTQPQVPSGFLLSGIHEYASMQPEGTETTNTNAATPKSLPDNSSVQVENPIPPGSTNVDTQEDKAEPSQKVENIPTASIQIPSISGPPSIDGSTGHSPYPVDQLPYPFGQPPGPAVQVIEEGYTTKNLVILNKFDDLSETARQAYGLFYNSRRTAKLVKHNPELCPITMQPAKYRDPATGIGYANMFAYKVLQELKEHKFTWSAMLGCYVGREGARVARGVPEDFPGR